MGDISKECTFIKPEVLEEDQSIYLLQNSDPRCTTNSKLDGLHAYVKQEATISETIPKSEKFLLKEEIIIKKEIQESLVDLTPPPTEEIYVKDEFATQSWISSNNLKGFTRIDNSYVCDVCDYQSMDIMKLKTHIVLHIKEKPFKCFECEYEVSSKFDLTLHIFNQHSEIFRCNQCKYTSAATHDKEQHMMIHNVEEEEHMKILAVEKPFKCEQCQYRTAKKYFLEKHMIKHSPENSFKCKECNFNTVLKSKLREHMKSHRKRKRVDLSKKI